MKTDESSLSAAAPHVGGVADAPFSSPPPPNAARIVSERDAGLDQTKGLLIVLVVVGHLVSSTATPPAGHEWYLQLRSAIYLFHMPAFFYLSGRITSLSFARIRPGGGTAFLLRRADRMLVPFFAMGLLILGAKFAADALLASHGVAASGHAAASLAGGVAALFVHTDNSPARAIWFLAAYFISICIALPLSRIPRGRVFLVLIGLALYATGLPAICYLNKFADNFVFFALGLHSARWPGKLSGQWVVPLACLLFACVFPAIWFHGFENGWVLLFGLGLSPIIIDAMSRRDIAVFREIGADTMMIYLLNTLVIGAVQAGFSLAHLRGFASFPPFVATATISAIALPMLLKRRVVTRMPLLARYLA